MAFSHDAPPLPGRAVIAQRWSRALFLHWRADAARLAPLPALLLDFVIRGKRASLPVVCSILVVCAGAVLLVTLRARFSFQPARSNS